MVKTLEISKDSLTNLKIQYRNDRPRSKAFFDRISRVIAGGVNGNLRFYDPFPTTFAKAHGVTLTDLDGHGYTDYLLSYGAMMLGHDHPVIRETIHQVWERQGTSSFGAPQETELEMAEVLRTFYPDFDLLRFTNSGLEATLLTLRVALAYTGRTHIAKFEGHYHGAHDQVLVSVSPDFNQVGQTARPQSIPASYAMPDYHLEHTVVLPFNDWSACEAILTTRKDQIGALILEPMQAGYIPAGKDFMLKLRKLTTQLGIVLIFDEVKTGFRVALGGAPEYYGVHPDLTALGKIIGGGFPIGVVGGRGDIMEMCATFENGRPKEAVYHSGTFNGNPISLAAGLATIRYLAQPGLFDGIVARTMDLRNGIEDLAKKAELPIRLLGVGCVFNLLFLENDVHNYRDLAYADQDLRLALDYLLMKNGVFSKPQNRFSLSSEHKAPEIASTLEAFKASFQELNSLIHNH